MSVRRTLPISELDLFACWIYRPIEFRALLEEWANQQDQRATNLIEMLKCQ